MLFNSYELLFFFLPLTLVVYYILGAKKLFSPALAWLVFASLVFYGWWNPVYLLLIVASIVFNYYLGKLLPPAGSATAPAPRKMLLFVGVAANLTTLGYFKYANFFVDNANAVLNTDIHLQHIVLPLAISFFTFQQITYLVDAYNGEAAEPSFLRYSLFVTFFPQLIAGPIVHHREMLPQFAVERNFRFRSECLAVGTTIFVLGLFKKVVIADNVAIYSTPLFDAALDGYEPTFFEAWGAALAYTFQLYFDFSGYSDMAVGLAFMFGIRLPLNFFSPYKADNITDFWRRWHISLSRFLRDYVYVPLGGNRRGPVRRYQNLMITMLLGGLWHGAGWTFVAWGALHGLYLVINQAWLKLKGRLFGQSRQTSALGRWTGRVMTFLAVVVGWVLFRAESFPAAVSILQGMAGLKGFSLPPSYMAYLNYLAGLGDFLSGQGWNFSSDDLYFEGVGQIVALASLLIFVWFTPNIYQLMGRLSPARDISALGIESQNVRSISWSPGPIMALVIFALFVFVIVELDSTSEFLYFQF